MDRHKKSILELTRISVEDYRRERKLPLTVMADNVRSAQNIGSILRTSDAFLVKEMVMAGISATPPNKEISKTSLGAEDSVSWRYAEDSVEEVRKMKEKGVIILVLEQAHDSIPLQEFLNDNFSCCTSPAHASVHKEGVKPSVQEYLLVVGNEVHGVRQEIVDMADYVLEIPMHGIKHSLNVAVSAGITIWHLYCALMPGQQSGYGSVQQPAPSISVIIPCYNAGEFLAPAIDSVIDQSFADWELLLLDDGSTDNTPDICRRYERQDPRIHYHPHPHSGVAAMRNAGIRHASARDVFFMDADDILAFDTLHTLLRLKERYDAGIVQGTIIRFKNDFELDEKLSWVAAIDINKNKVMVMDGLEAAGKSLYQKIERGPLNIFGVDNSCAGKLFRKDIFDGLEFKEGELYEDLNIFYRLALRCRTYVLTSFPCYFYRQNPRSIMHTFNRERLIVTEVTRRIEEYVKANCPQIAAAAADRRFAANFNMFRLMNKSDEKLLYAREIDATYSYIKSHAKSVLADRNSRLKNRLGALAAILLPKAILSKL